MSTVELAIAPPRRESRLSSKLFAAITELGASDTVTALMLAANVFLLLGSYYILKTVREALILSEAGAAVKSYSAAGQALLLLAVIPAYSFIASKVDRVRLITWVTVFFISHLAIFYVFGIAGVRIGVAFYLWVGVFNVLIIAQFWAFANDIYDSKTGQRVFPFIGIGSALGAWLGSVELTTQQFALLNMGLVGVWILLVVGIWKYRDAEAQC